MNDLRWMFVAVATTSLALFGCEREREQAQEELTEVEEHAEELAEETAEAVRRPFRGEERAEAPEGMEPLSTPAVMAISSARCDREQRCGNIGPQADFNSLDECKTSVRDEWRSDLVAYECREGVVQSELNECLEEIRNEDCASPFDTLARVVACRSTDICA